MKYRYSLFGIGLAGLFFAFTFLPRESGNYQKKEAVLMSTVIQMLDQLHYNPAELNDEFSELAFDNYLENIDRRKQFLLGPEVEELAKYRYLLDDEARHQTFQFMDESIVIIDKAHDRAYGMFQEAMEKDYDFNTAQTIELDPDKYGYADGPEALQARWDERVKYEILQRTARKIRRQQEEDFDGEPMSRDEIIAESREKVKENLENFFDRINRNRRVDYLSSYMNSLVNIYDPHTGYFKPKDKQDFDMRMSGTLEGIGAQLTQKGDYVEVVRIVPGGPAWKQKQLEVKDRILKVAQGDDEEALDVVGWHIDDVISKIRGPKGTKVRLTVKKEGGEIVEIPIIRDVIVFEESYVKSYILQHEDLAQRIGYINLPSFYTASFGSEDGRSSGEDVKQELRKLNEEKVSGIILDLRNNGGGSLRDVVEMSGFFIEKGPVVQVKSRDRKPYVLEDKDPTVMYNGPLIVLVNSFSASASEILAAAMQDYERAIVVGSSSTFGKGTVQRFYDLDRSIKGHSELKPLGELKITTQKFYRVDGGSTQLKGVTPDVILPDPYNHTEIGEREYDYALDWTEIPAVEYDQRVYHYTDIPYLRVQSEDRVESNETFQKVEEYALFLKERREDTDESLNLETYLAEAAENERLNDRYDDLYTEIEDLRIENLLDDMDYIQADSSRIARNEDFMKNLRKDIYVEEAMAIMADMLGAQ